MAKKTREELEEIELRALEEAVRELNKFYDDDDDDDAGNVLPFSAFLNAAAKAAPGEADQTPSPEAPAKEAAAEEKPKKTRRTTKKSSTGKADGKKPAKKTAARKPRKKAFVPNFVIQNTADMEITYEAVVEKVQAAITAADVSSIDIYVKAEEGKAYYVVNGQAAGSVDLF